MPTPRCPLRSPLLLALLLCAPAARAQHFQAVNSASLGEDFTCVGISHRDSNFVMVGTSTGSLLRSLDGGASWQRIVITPSRTLYFGRERSPDPRMEYALGLPGKSPHLQSWLRQKGLNTSGTNWQQLLVTKGDKMTSVNWIEVDWHDENRIYVGTVDGLYLSRDKGRTFIRIYQGRSSMAERMVNTVATDPARRGFLLMGTASGLFTSKDGGATFTKTMNYYMRSSYIREIWFDPEQQGLVHLAMGGSAMASPDGGEHWITTHWDEWGPRADVQSISLGPQNVRLIGTGDGVFASWQGGEMGTWKRRGERFIGETILKVLASADPKLWFALTSDAFWVTVDSGANWSKVMQLGGGEAPRALRAFRGDPGQMWLITNRQIYRMGQIKGLLTMRSPSARRTIAAPQRILDVPGMHDFLYRVLKRSGVHFADLQRARNRAPWAALLPYVSVGAHYSRYADIMNIKDYLHPHWPYHYYNSSLDGGITFEAFAFWELDRLFFDKRQLPHWGRVDRNLAAVRRDLTERIHRLYPEYIRAAKLLVFRPPQDALARSYLKIRVQEIAAYFDSISGGLWTKKTGEWK